MLCVAGKSAELGNPDAMVSSLCRQCDGLAVGTSLTAALTGNARVVGVFAEPTRTELSNEGPAGAPRPEDRAIDLIACSYLTRAAEVPPAWHTDIHSCSCCTVLRLTGTESCSPDTGLHRHAAGGRIWIGSMTQC